MIKENVTVQDAVDLLNELLKLDYDCISRLVTTRIPCNEQVADHPTVATYQDNRSQSSYLGLLGIINGLFGTNEAGSGPICFLVEDNDVISSFQKTPTQKD